MNPERLESMLEAAVSHDTETWLIKPGLAAPRMVCWSAGWYDKDAGQCVGQIGPRDSVAVDETGGKVVVQDGADAFMRLLDDESIVVVGANYSFDLVVLLVHMARLGHDVFPKVRKMLEDGRVFDVQIAEQLHAIARGHLGKDPRTMQDIINPETKKPGRYSLATCVDMVLGRGDAKANDEWRLRYAELDGIPIEQWPRAAIDYPIDDARNTVECALAQAGHLPRVVMQHAQWAPNDDGVNACTQCGKTTYGGTCMAVQPNENLHDLARQQRAHTALALAGAWGFRVNQAKVDIIEKQAIWHRDEGMAPFVEAGFMRRDGSECQAVVKRAVALAYGSRSPCPVCTGSGKVPSPSAKAVRCRKCAGQGLNCDECAGVGKRVYAMINCCLSHPTDSKKKIKTCDGTGLVLVDDVPRTDTGGVAAGRDLLYESGDDLLMAYAEYCEDDKVLATYVPYLRSARACVECGAAGTKKSPHTCRGAA